MLLAHLCRPGGRGRSAGIISQRRFHDFIRGPTDNGTYKIPLSSQKIVGVCTSRGSRPYQEDATAIAGLQLPISELKRSLGKMKQPWNEAEAGGDFLARQTAFFGIYDGHGGREVSGYIKENLHSLVESVKVEDVVEVLDWTIDTHAGYFKRWKGGALGRWSKFAETKPDEGEGLTLEERLSLAFLKADMEVLNSEPKAQRCGSTASVLLLHSLDSPAQPYWAAKKLHLTVGHCGDTRILLCHRPMGNVIPLTEKHHAEARVESSRLRRMGAGRVVSDSFGESRWMGVIENTRGFGDGQWKTSGVTAEPAMVTKIIDGEDHAYIILVTDGLTSLMSDQEIIDLARNAGDPTRAAKAIVHFGEELGALDNCTCIVVPLAGWGKVGGTDTSESRREYRKRQAGMVNTRMQRM